MNIVLDSYKHLKNKQYLFVFFLFLSETSYPSLTTIPNTLFGAFTNKSSHCKLLSPLTWKDMVTITGSINQQMLQHQKASFSFLLSALSEPFNSHSYFTKQVTFVTGFLHFLQIHAFFTVRLTFALKVSYCSQYISPKKISIAISCLKATKEGKLASKC